MVPLIISGVSIATFAGTDSAKAYACGSGWCYNTYSDGSRSYWPQSPSTLNWY